MGVDSGRLSVKRYRVVLGVLKCVSASFCFLVGSYFEGVTLPFCDPSFETFRTSLGQSKLSADGCRGVVQQCKNSGTALVQVTRKTQNLNARGVCSADK